MLNTVNKLFKDNFNLSISVFDNSRGQTEGEEHEKVLSFYPPNTSDNVQCSIIGLAQAVITFSNTFNKDQGCELMEAENNRWVVYNCEPNIWILLIVRKTWVGTTCPNALLHNYLRKIHGVFTLLNGSITQLLQQDESGATACMRLQPFTVDLAERLLQPDSPDLAQLTNPLAMAQGCPFLQLSRRAFLSVQSLVNNLLILNVYGARVLQGCLLMHGPCVLWSTLPQPDTLASYAFAAASLLPSVRNGNGGSGIGGSTGTALRGLLRVSSTSSANHAPSQSDSGAPTLLPSTRWVPQTGGFLSPDTPPATFSSSRRSTGSPDDPIIEAPPLWLQGSTEPSVLLPYQHGNQLLLLFLHEGVSLTQEVVTALREVLVPRCNSLATCLPQDLSPSTLWHLPGHRYLYQDHLTSVTRGSPANKVATLSATSRTALADLRNSLDLHTLHCAGEGEEDWEVVCRAHHDCWLAARGAAQREVWVAMEGDKEDNLVGVGGKVQTLCDEQFPGVFEI